jgi:sodium-dependent phosphate cotransporter
MNKDNNWSLRTVAFTIVSVLAFLLSIDMLGLGLGQFAENSFLDITSATSNPFVGLFIGLLVTAILQSSSTTTSLAVAAVASGSITLENAIPMILGANVGTTITSTIVAFGYINKGNEFLRAVSAAMLHDMFNIIGVLILFPLELNYHFLQDLSFYISSAIPITSSAGQSFWAGRAFDFVGESILHLTGRIVFLVLSIVLLFGSIKMLSKLLYISLVGKRQEQFQNAVFKNPFRSFGWGLAMTAVVQSSSLTTSLIVPLVATGKVQLGKTFHFIMGANIGTTITAILAALFRSEAAMSLAIAHFLFNVIVSIVYSSLPFVGKMPIYCAEKLGFLMARYRISAFIYITMAFFAIPFALIYFSRPPEAQEPSAIEKVKKIEEP